jgi:hypothetical protein
MYHGAITALSNDHGFKNQNRNPADNPVSKTQITLKNKNKNCKPLKQGSDQPVI